ncbi:hypothetical protein ElyMa_003130200 [Elysia marginata]|uniref:Uncharacterized protein n=1 Tax=Elysia marginata TaxID=1093978 RepID=A0AAV4IRH6_9GAST|nr:hypothetical protein ElyMa_003130200 [Elysia marginata]
MLYPVLAIGNFVVMIVSFAINGLSGSGPDGRATNSVFTVVLLTAACLLAVVKLTVTIYRHLYSPRYRTMHGEGEALGMNKSSENLA